MPSLPRTFGLLEGDDADYAHAATAILPVPFERTTSYGKGTGDGPEAILRASHALELYDQELDAEPHTSGIATLDPFLPESYEMAEAMAEIQAEAARVQGDGKFLVTLGGEHSLTIAPVRAAAERCGGPAELGVVQFDAHADLRAEYEGTPYSHASVMRRVVEDGHPTLAVGIRSLSAPEAELIRERDLAVIWGRELAGCRERFRQELAKLPERVYLTFDVDYFDPSVIPTTGTPEPGGGTWYPTLALLRDLFAAKEVVAMDLVELAPRAGLHGPEFLCAKLVYKCVGYRFR
jgi:agmatinase